MCHDCNISSKSGTSRANQVLRCGTVFSSLPVPAASVAWLAATVRSHSHMPGNEASVFAVKVGTAVSPCVAMSTTVVAQKMTKCPSSSRGATGRPGRTGEPVEGAQVMPPLSQFC